MGCICAGQSDIENFLTEFIEELRIRRYSEKNFFQYLEKNNPFRSMRTNYDEFLRSNQNEEVHKNYQNILFAKSNPLFHASLVLLLNSESKNLASNYKLVIDKLRNSHLEFKQETLQEFNKDDYSVLSDVLKFYVRMVSLDIVEALQLSKGAKFTEEQAKILNSNYNQRIIDFYVEDLMKNTKFPNVNYEEFFSRNHTNLKHPIVRERLRNMFETGKIPLVNSSSTDSQLVCRQKPESKILPETVRETNYYSKNNDQKNNYQLQENQGRNNSLGNQENFGRNNYLENEVEEVVESAAPDRYGYELEEENARIAREMEKMKIEQYNNYRQECLYHHNKIREMHGVPTLKEDLSLSEYSQQWANFLSETDTLTHSSMIWEGKNIGENIAKAGAVINDPSQLICYKWYEEKDNYDFTKHGSQNNTKNFTQMVWKKTKSVGFGLSYSQTGNTYIVVNYYPAGNLVDEFEENVKQS